MTKKSGNQDAQRVKDFVEGVEGVERQLTMDDMDGMEDKENSVSGVVYISDEYWHEVLNSYAPSEQPPESISIHHMAAPESEMDRYKDSEVYKYVYGGERGGREETPPYNKTGNCSRKIDVGEELSGLIESLGGFIGEIVGDCELDEVEFPSVMVEIHDRDENGEFNVDISYDTDRITPVEAYYLIYEVGMMAKRKADETATEYRPQGTVGNPNVTQSRRVSQQEKRQAQKMNEFLKVLK